jgi:hypothetical protein
MTIAKPLARYGAIGRASRAASLPPSYTTTGDLTRESRALCCAARGLDEAVAIVVADLGGGHHDLSSVAGPAASFTLGVISPL